MICFTLESIAFALYTLMEYAYMFRQTSIRFQTVRKLHQKPISYFRFTITYFNIIYWAD